MRGEEMPRERRARARDAERAGCMETNVGQEEQIKRKGTVMRNPTCYAATHRGLAIGPGVAPHRVSVSMYGGYRKFVTKTFDALAHQCQPLYRTPRGDPCKRSSPTPVPEQPADRG
jgi:hypothetical protein